MAVSTKTEAPTSLLVAIGSALTRDMFREHLAKNPTLRLLGEAENWGRLVDTLERERPGLLLLSCVLPGMADPQALAPLLERGDPPRVVAILRPDTPPRRVNEVLALRPRAIVSTEMHMPDLLKVLDLVARGMVVFPYGFRALASAAPDVHPGGLVTPGALSQREMEVLQLLARGHSEKEAAALLGITRRTIHTYLERIRGKLGALNRTHAVAIAAAGHLVHLQDASPSSR